MIDTPFGAPSSNQTSLIVAVSVLVAVIAGVIAFIFAVIVGFTHRQYKLKKRLNHIKYR